MSRRHQSISLQLPPTLRPRPCGCMTAHFPMYPTRRVGDCTKQNCDETKPVMSLSFNTRSKKQSQFSALKTHEDRQTGASAAHKISVAGGHSCPPASYGVVHRNVHHAQNIIFARTNPFPLYLATLQSPAALPIVAIFFERQYGASNPTSNPSPLRPKPICLRCPTPWGGIPECNLESRSQRSRSKLWGTKSRSQYKVAQSQGSAIWLVEAKPLLQ